MTRMRFSLRGFFLAVAICLLNSFNHSSLNVLCCSFFHWPLDYARDKFQEPKKSRLPIISLNSTRNSTIVSRLFIWFPNLVEDKLWTLSRFIPFELLLKLEYVGLVIFVSIMLTAYCLLLCSYSCLLLFAWDCRVVPPHNDSSAFVVAHWLLLLPTAPVSCLLFLFLQKHNIKCHYEDDRTW